jgi:hypothetical protein
VHAYDHVIAIDADGKEIWKLKTGTRPHEDVGRPIALDEKGRLYVNIGYGLVCLTDK